MCHLWKSWENSRLNRFLCSVVQIKSSSWERLWTLDIVTQVMRRKEAGIEVYWMGVSHPASVSPTENGHPDTSLGRFSGQKGTTHEKLLSLVPESRWNKVSVLLFPPLLFSPTIHLTQTRMRHSNLAATGLEKPDIPTCSVDLDPEIRKGIWEPDKETHAHIYNIPALYVAQPDSQEQTCPSLCSDMKPTVMQSSLLGRDGVELVWP